MAAIVLLLALSAPAQELLTENLEVFLEYGFAEARMPGIVDGNAPWADAPSWDEPKSSGHWAKFRFKGKATNENVARMLEDKAKTERPYPFCADQLKQAAQQIRSEPTQLHEILSSPGDAAHYEGKFWKSRARDSREEPGLIAVRTTWRYLVSAPMPGSPAVFTTVPLNVVIRHVNVWEAE